MKNKVFFLKNVCEIPFETNKNDLIICHEMYDSPKDVSCDILEWQKFKIVYSDVKPERLILVGINRMITPSNRCDMVNDFLQVLTPTQEKISVDTSPFVGEPWRLFFHYSICFGGFANINYSYPIEGDWLKWFYREKNDCIISPENISILTKGTFSDLDFINSTFSFFEVSEKEKEKYQEYKNFVFGKYSTPKLIIRNLLKMTNSAYEININYDSYLENKNFSLPDLGIYRFIAEENVRRMNIYNEVLK